MRILLFNSTFEPFPVGGSAMSVKELAVALNGQGHDVAVVSIMPYGSECKTFEKIDGIDMYRIRSKAMSIGRHRLGRLGGLFRILGELCRRREAQELQSLLRRFEPDIVHFNDLAGLGWLGWWAARNVATVQTVRSSDLVCLGSRLHRGWNCRGTKLVCRVLNLPMRIPWIQPLALCGPSEFALEMAIRAGIRPRRLARVVYNRPPAVLNGNVRDGVGPCTSFRVAFLGRLDPRKGVDIVAEAVRRLGARDRGINVKLTIAGCGDAEYERSLRARFEDLIRVGALEFTGISTPEVAFVECDLAVVPSQWDEIFGRVLAEALQFGVPVAYSACGGLPEVHELYGGLGIAVENYSDPDSWVRAMVSAYEGRHTLLTPRTGLDRRHPVDAYGEVYSSLTSR